MSDRMALTGSCKPPQRCATHWLLAGVLSLLSVGALAGPACADDVAWLRLSAITHQGDHYALGDPGSTTHGDVGGSAALGWGLTPRWGLSGQVRMAGSWAEFGRWGERVSTKELVWSAAAMLEHRWAPDAKTRVIVAAGPEYGEFHSWYYRDPLFDRSGTREIFVGTTTRIAIEHELWSFARGTAGLTQSFYRARSENPDTGEPFAWLGRSVDFELGIVLVAPPRRE